jgi:Arc/MetJ family transcription regulator
VSERACMRFRPLALLLCTALAAAPTPAFAWGSLGHRIVNGAAMRKLPDSVPAFLRTLAAHDEVSLLGPEADRVKGAGPPLDDDDNPGHYLDARDDFSIAGVVKLSALPKDRAAYDSALRTATPATDEFGQGYLPYQIADGWQRIVRDLAYWRVDVVGQEKAPTPEERAFFTYDRTVREVLTLRDIGYWGHFVADASQPLHVSVHFNGWDGAKYGNPNNFSESRTIHARFETALVQAVATEGLVAARVHDVRLSSDPLLAQVGAYLTATETKVPDVYRLEAAGGIDGHSPAATTLVLDCLAAGASQMRDFIVEAWQVSGDGKVGYPGISVHDVESGAVVPTRANVGLGD